MKKYAPYSEIINISEELKEYKKLCRGKSKRFIYYLDWKKYISQKVSRLDSPDKKENFKHYLLNHSRVNKNIFSHYIAIMVFCMNPIINYVTKIHNIINTLIIVLLVLFLLLISHDSNNKEYCFYCDLIEVLEEIEKKEADKCPTPKPYMKTQ